MHLDNFWLWGHFFVEVFCKQLIKMACGPLTFVNTVSAVRVSHHRKVLIVFDQFVYEYLAVLKMAVVISGSIDDE